MPGGTNQNLRPFLWRAERLYPDTEIVSRTKDGLFQYTYHEYAKRTAQLANALTGNAPVEDNRIATFAWNHHRHFETYFGIPSLGAQLHTINPLLPNDHIKHIIGDAQDRAIFVDPSLVEKLASAFDPDAFESVEKFIIFGESIPDVPLEPMIDYESFIAGQSTDFDWPIVSEDQPAGLCYTSGTTGKPKGVEYTHQMIWAHTMMQLTPQGFGVTDDDVVMPVVPMFHVNAWGLPFSTTAAGAKQVYPGPSPEPEDLVNLIEEEEVTITAGVPSVWLGFQEYINNNPDVNLSSLDTVLIGGSAAPQALIEWFDERDITLLHGWGMTEMSPMGALAHLKDGLQDLDDEDQVDLRSKQGLTLPGLEFKVVDDDGEEVPWDGESFGELFIRGPTVTQEYFNRPEANNAGFEDGWLKTGDIVTVDENGYIEIVDRASDIIKSGGEWISSMELEDLLMAHDNVLEAAVIGVPHERWQERPVAFVVSTDDANEKTLATELQEEISKEHPKWWVPDSFQLINEVPKTATGKFDKNVLRKEYATKSLIEGKAPE